MTRECASGISRRSFLSGAALVGAAAAGGALLTGCSAGQPNGGGGEAIMEGALDPTHVENVGYGWINTENTKPIDPVEAPDAWDYEADVVVVGSGAGGIISTCRLAAEGLKVVCIEAQNHLMGTSQDASWLQTYGGIPSIYGDWGVFSQPYDRQVVYDYWMEKCFRSADPELMWGLVDAGTEWPEWFVQNGLKLVDFLEAGGVSGAFSGCVAVPDSSLYTEIGMPGYARNCRPTLEAMISMAEGYGAEFKTLSPARALVVQDGRVIGVKAEGEDGGETFYKAAKAVVLCAGDFSYNRDMLLRYVPKVGLGAPNSVESTTNNGLCARMALGLGATMAGFNSFSVRDGTIDVGDLTKDKLDPENREVRYRSMFYADEVLCRQPWLSINKAGQRMIFYFSGDGAAAESAEVNMSNSEMGTTGHRKYVIFDDNALKNHAKSFGQLGGRVILNESMPFMDDPDRTPATLVDHDFDEGVARSLEAGYVKQADTLEELAALLGLDAEKVIAAVDRWNTNCEAGVDEPGYGYESEWLIPIAQPPYYGACMGGSIQAIQCGLRVNADMQVLKDDLDPIPGLYAGFHTAGGGAGDGVQCSAIYSCVGKSAAGGWMTAKGVIKNEM